MGDDTLHAELGRQGLSIMQRMVMSLILMWAQSLTGSWVRWQRLRQSGLRPRCCLMARLAAAGSSWRPSSLNRQLTDERTLSGYITDTDSTAEVVNLSRGGSEVVGAQLPAAKQPMQSARSREVLSAAGLDRPRPSHGRLPSGYLADSDSQDLGSLKRHGSIDSTAATVATSK